MAHTQDSHEDDRAEVDESALHTGGLPRLPGALHAYEDDVTVCGAGSVHDASTRIKEGGGAW